MSDALPLSPYTVLDLTIARAGPTAVRLLADWGANVIKIEAPVTGESASCTGVCRTLLMWTNASFGDVSPSARETSDLRRSTSSFAFPVGN